MDGGSTEQVETLATPAVSLQELEAQITALAGQLNAANYRWLTLIAEFDLRLGWADGKLPSCAHWLNFKCGLNLGAAREKVRVAHSLADLPKIAASMGRGELSYSKVRALTRVACPATEETLLMIALHGTAYHVERLVRGYRRAQQAAEISREAQQHAGRSVNYYYADDGSLIVKCRLPALAGAMLVKALDAAMENPSGQRDLRRRGGGARDSVRGSPCGRNGRACRDLSRRTGQFIEHRRPISGRCARGCGNLA